MLCPRCNNQLESDAAFCGVCGALIRPKLSGETVLEAPDSLVSNSPASLAPTRYAVPQVPLPPLLSTMVEQQLPDEQAGHQRSTRDTPLPHTPYPRNNLKQPPRFFVSIAVLTILVVITGGLYWYLTATGSKTSAPAAVAKGQVNFLNSQNSALGVTDALKVTATGLSNPPEGSEYDVWLIDTGNEKILPLGSLSKSNPTTFALSYSNPDSQSQTNLVGAGNKIEITQEQGQVTVPVGKVVLSATFPPQAFVHIRHLLFKFPTTPGNIGLLTGLVNETQKVNSLALLLQNNATSGNTASVACIAQAMVNIIEGKNGAHFRPLAPNCARVGVSDALTGDGFGILGNGYITTTANHAALAASQSDTTDGIRLAAKDIEASTASIKVMITNIDNDLLQLQADPTTAASQVPDIVSLAGRAYRGFDQNGNGKVEPVVGEAGALTAYTSGQLMAGLSLV